MKGPGLHRVFISTTLWDEPANPILKMGLVLQVTTSLGPDICPLTEDIAEVFS